jgi:hypothetical protein
LVTRNFVIHCSRCRRTALSAAIQRELILPGRPATAMLRPQEYERHKKSPAKKP